MRKGILVVLASLIFSASKAEAQPANIYTFPGPNVDLGQSYIGREVSGGHYIGGRGNTVYVFENGFRLFAISPQMVAAPLGRVFG